MMFEDAELHWERALELLRSQGADIEQLLSQGAENIRLCEGQQSAFPLEFPKDEL